MRNLHRAAASFAVLSLITLSACGSDKKVSDTTSAATSAATSDTTLDTTAATTTAAAAPAGNEAAAGVKAPDIPALASLGDGEGSVNLISWAGYTEKAWVEPFETASGCKVNAKIGNTSDEMIQLMKTGEYDGVSASGDATLRLIAAGDVAPVNTDLVPAYKDIYDGLKLKAWNSVGGKAYGIPHGRGANILMYNTDQVKPAPDSWSVVFDPASPYKGKITAYDYIADAAMYLMATKPDLGIKNPYALDDKQFAAAVDLLKAQKPLVSEYWSDYAKSQAAFKSGSTLLGTTWQVIANGAKGEGTKIETVLPKEGGTGWSDTWMVAAKAKHPNCMYKWMDWIAGPDANAQMAEFYGQAPANKLACTKTKDPNHCASYHADDETYFSKIWYWTTPTKDCLDGRGPICKDYLAWTKAWTEIRG
jgi:putative spermidine/putrescine transport system substrate-binding protein